MLDLINTSFNTNYLGRWAAHYYSLTEGQPADFSGDLKFIKERGECALRKLPPNAPFRITTNDGQPFSTSNLTARLDGTAGVAVHHLRQGNASVALDATWVSLSNWQAAVALAPGTNTVVLWGMSPRDVAVASNSIVIVCIADAPSAAPLLINEFMASNNGSVRDEYGNASDWVELFNMSLQAVSLSNMYLTDRVATPTEWALPPWAVLAPTGFALVWADGATNLGPWHAPFKLAKSGEQIMLTHVAGGVTGRLHLWSFGAQLNDISCGLFPDGVCGTERFMPPSPRAPNLVPEPVLAAFALLVGIAQQRNRGTT